MSNNDPQFGLACNSDTVPSVGGSSRNEVGERLKVPVEIPRLVLREEEEEEEDEEDEDIYVRDGEENERRLSTSVDSEGASTNPLQGTVDKLGATEMSLQHHNVENHEPTVEENEPSTWREVLYVTLDQPASSKIAQVFAMISLTAIVASTIVLCIETVPPYQAEQRNQTGPWFTLETVFVVFFTVELVVRFSVAPDRKKFIRQPLNVLDFVAVLPYYLEAAMGGSGTTSGFRVLRVIRVLRVFRLLKVARYAEGIRMILLVMGKLGDVLVLVLFVVAISLILWGSCQFFIEGSQSRFDKATETWYRETTIGLTANSTETYSPFQSIPASFWWALSTITVVGYGDEVPITAGGKALAAAAMLSGTLLIAIPASVFGSNFLAEYSNRGRERARVKHLHQQHRADAAVKILHTLLSIDPGCGSVVEPILTGVFWSQEYAAKVLRQMSRCEWEPTPAILTHLSKVAPDVKKCETAHHGYFDIGSPGVEAMTVPAGGLLHYSTPESYTLSVGDIGSRKVSRRRLSRIVLPPPVDDKEQRRLTLPQDPVIRKSTIPQGDQVMSTLLRRSSYLSNGTAASFRKSKKPQVPCPVVQRGFNFSPGQHATPPEVVILPATPDNVRGAASTVTTTPPTLTIDAGRVESVDGTDDTDSIEE